MAVPFENRNFHKEMLKLAGQLQKEGKVPRLLLHSCCAPCSSNCIEVLSKYFMVTVFYYNPNISSDEEYKKRVAEQIRFIKEFDTPNKVEFIEGDYEPDVFFKEVKGLEKEPEGGKRCFKCYELRLRKTAELAKAEAYDYFTTTLTISPLKNSVKLNETGLKLQEEYVLITCFRILRSRKVIRGLLSCQRNMDYTDRITAAVYIQDSRY